jgi:signal transduction histidine kinase/CheY-like chemotaxis protein
MNCHSTKHGWKSFPYRRWHVTTIIALKGGRLVVTGDLILSQSKREQELQARIRALEVEVAELRQSDTWSSTGETVRVPAPFAPLFEVAQQTVRKFFSRRTWDPTKATIEISDERYVLLRASSLSVDFLNTIKNLYADHGEAEAFAIGRNFLFDISHVIGMEDAKNFHRKMGVTDPIAKLSAGPVHFAYAGWAFVDISPESTPIPDESFFIKYDHPFSFEADSWQKAGQQSDVPVCIMNSGYSSGWCEESFGIPLTAVELTCKAAGDETCTFVMAPPHRIEEHIQRYMHHRTSQHASLRIPSFFERKRVEEEMKSARKKAEESDRMKSAFLANMSHEIRSPMNGVIGMTNLVLETELTEMQRDYLMTARESAESLMAIINEILDFSKIEAGVIELEQEPFAVRQFLNETMKSYLLRCKSKAIELKWHVAPDVPDQLVGDDIRLRQVIVNLVENAIKFTSQGGIELSVSLEARESMNNHAMLHFQVSDTGIGIPPEKLNLIFEAFTQADMSTTRRFGGTGLGLTISHELVRLMNGRIWCEKNDGPGSTFHFVVPLQQQELSISDEPAPDLTTVANAPDTHADDQTLSRTLNVLVAEDGLVNQTVVKAMLNSWGHNVTIANHGKEALQRWREAPDHFDFILMDVLMPEMDGLESTAMIRAEEQGTDRHIPIIAVTAQAMAGDREACLNAGMDAYISKPFHKSELQQIVHQFFKA